VMKNVKRIKYERYRYLKDNDKWLCYKGDEMLCYHSDAVMREFVVAMIHGGKTVKINNEKMVIR